MDCDRRGRDLGVGFEALLAAAQAGAAWAFDRIYRELSPAIAGYLRIQGSTEPEDLTSEVFLKAFTGIRLFTGGEVQFRSWVFTIAHHRLVDERRGLARRPPASDAGVDDRVGGDVEDEALRRLSAERVRRLCDSLAPDQRDVLLLRMVAGMTTEQAAEALGKSIGAVKALQHRAVAALRRQFDAEAVSL